MFHWDVITVSSGVVTKLVPNCFKLKERYNLSPPSEIREENFVSKGIFFLNTQRFVLEMAGRDLFC